MAIATAKDNSPGLSGKIKNSAAFQRGNEIGNSMSVLGAIRVIGGAMIMMGILLVVLNNVFTLDSIANSTGPFADIITQTQNTGGAALGLLVIGLLAAAGNRIMGMFGGGGSF